MSGGRGGTRGSGAYFPDLVAIERHYPEWNAENPERLSGRRRGGVFPC
jgi:hypothetical protein